MACLVRLVMRGGSVRPRQTLPDLRTVVV